MPLTEKVFRDFYMEEASQAGILVEYWDITKLFFKHNFEQEDASHLTNTRKFTSYTDLEQAILNEQHLSKILFISIMTFEGRVGKLYELFTKYNCQLAVFGRNMFPLPNSKNLSLIKRIAGLNVTIIINYLRSRRLLKKKLEGKIKSYDILFLGGNNGWQGVGYINSAEIEHAEIVKINSDDYDNFLKARESASSSNDEFILFLDEYLPFHPDTKLFNINTVAESEYYPELCKYFERVESQFGIPVVIAAHPKALKYKTKDFFKGRKVYFGNTAELTSCAKFVIAHDSTSINYPIAFGKKIHFITSKNIQKSINIVHKNVLHFAEYLGCNYQWFDKEEYINLIDEVPTDKYDNYKYDFQTSLETESVMTKNIFINFLSVIN